MSKKEKKINYYETYQDDFVASQDQNYELPKDYKWIHNNILYKIGSRVVYFIAYIISFFYCKFALHIEIKNRKVLRKYKKQGYFLYGNHTLPIGDAFIPAHICGTKRIYTIASSSNLKVKFIGKLLPMLGILPIPTSITGTKEFLKAVNKRYSENKCIVIYPEAHVWPYYTKIRPFPKSAFKFPVENNSISFCSTTTYHKRRLGKKPKIIIYIDGPFKIKEELNKKERQEKLSEQIYNKMIERSRKSNYEYIEYRKK